MKQEIQVKGIGIKIIDFQSENYISLTDIAKKKNFEEPRFVIINWLRNRNTLEFLGIWEKIYNKNFNRVEFETIKNQSGLNSFAISPSKWIKFTNSIGMITKSGKYNSGTFAHIDIALEFASWLSPEFKLYFIKEFRRLKEQENKTKNLDWNLKRTLTKINFEIHTNAIKEKLIPKEISLKQKNLIYATETDILNLALFGKTAKQWKKENPKKEGNLRDNANITQLICLSNLESLNSVLIKENIPQNQRLIKLNKIAISQMSILIQNLNLKKFSQ